MTYIGQQPATTFDAGIQDRFTGLSTNTVTLTHEIAAEEDILVVWNNIVQDKNTYSVGGTGNKTLTLGGTLVSADVVTVYYLNKVMQSVNPTAGSVTTATINDTAVTGAKLNTDVISAQTALGATPADTDEFLVSDAGVLKRVDYSYIKGELNTPAFFAHRSSGAGVSSGSTTLIQPDNELYDTDSAYNTSNGKFTVPSGKAGKYFIHCGVYFASITDGDVVSCEIYINGGAKALVREHTGCSGNISVQCTFSGDLSAADEVTYKVDQNSGGSLNTSGDTLTFLSGFKIA